MRLIALAFALFTLAACARAPGDAPGDATQSLIHAGRERSYILHLSPTLAPERKYPLVIVLHGGGGNAASAGKMTGMNQQANRENFIVVYPNGAGRLGDRLLTWNSGNCCGYALDHQVDDVGFLRALVERLLTQYPIDPKRVYATGISNGGMMSYRLACEASDLVAAIAPVAAALNTECKPVEPV